MGKAQKLGNMPNAPAFSAYRSSTNQSITSGAWAKVQCQTEEFDTASAYDNATNYRFTPQVAGYYQVTGNVYFTGTGLTSVGVQIYKNGSAFKLGTSIAGTSNSEAGASVSALIYLNGSTDYVELYGLTVGTSPAVYAGQNLSYFQASLVRPA
jgi:hypothetical protein